MPRVRNDRISALTSCPRTGVAWSGVDNRRVTEVVGRHPRHLGSVGIRHDSEAAQLTAPGHSIPGTGDLEGAERAQNGCARPR